MIGLALLVSVRALSPLAGRLTPKTPDSFAAEDTTPLAVKADRLVGADDGIAPDKAAVKTVKVAFPAPAASKDPGLVAAPKKWRPTYASMRGRAHANRHYKKRHRHRR